MLGTNKNPVFTLATVSPTLHEFMATASKVRYVMFYDMSNVQLAEVHSERDTWRRQQEQKTDERIQLDAQIGLLKDQIADITVKLQKERDEFAAANEVLLLKVEKLNSENRNIGLENATLKVESQGEKMRSSLDMKETIHEANSQLQQKVDALQKQMEELQGENQGLVRRLAGQEDALHYSSRHLEQRSADCHALNRELEAALADVRQQVSKVKDKAVSRESSFQTKILELEGEKSRRENELKQIKQSNQLPENKFEVRLKDLQLSLNQSDSHKQSIQNYVDFLKNSYSTMFDEGLPPATSSFGSSYFLK